MEAAPQRHVRREWRLSLNPHQMLDGLEAGHRGPLEELLSGQERAVELAPGESSVQRERQIGPGGQAVARASSRNWISSGSMSSAGSKPKT
jgi:hypothetical protein